MSENTLTAGVSRIDITPPIGFRMQGIMRRIEPSTGIHMPLHATALVLADDNHKIVIIDCDLIGLDLPLADEIRGAVADRIGTEPSHVTVACTHTHNSPSTVRTSLGGPHDIAPRPGEIESLDAYVAELVDKLAGLASAADADRRPARAGAARGEAAVNINREQMMDDGRVFVGRNPDGVTDHGVDVLRVDDLEGRPIAVVCCFAAHPVVMGMDSFLLGPDYPGVVRRIVDQTVGGTTLFLTGCAGNQATIEFLQHDWDEVERIGGIIGCEAAKTAIGIETRPHEVVMEAGGSMSNLAVYSKRFHDGPTHRVLDAASRTATVPLQPLPSLAEAEAQAADAERELAEAVQRGVTVRETVPLLLMERWTKGVLEKVGPASSRTNWSSRSWATDSTTSYSSRFRESRSSRSRSGSKSARRRPIRWSPGTATATSAICPAPRRSRRAAWPSRPRSRPTTSRRRPCPRRSTSSSPSSASCWKTSDCRAVRQSTLASTFSLDGRGGR